jgi:hypothetical protein
VLAPTQLHAYRAGALPELRLDASHGAAARTGFPTTSATLPATTTTAESAPASAGQIEAVTPSRSHTAPSKKQETVREESGGGA